MVTDNSCISP